MTAGAGLVIALLYPELLGTYGDQGNALVLASRLRWRGTGSEVVTVPLGKAVPDQVDLYVLGGGEDAGQVAALRALQGSPGFARAVTDGRTVLAVCAGLQLLGTSFTLQDGRPHAGLGVLDVTTTRLQRRAVGDVLADAAPDLGLPRLVGFENHGGRTVLGPRARPLARVVTGTGNGSEDRAEGALQAGIVATYLHGPVLALNPDLADLVLARATGRPLDPLPDEAVERLRAERLSTLQRPGRRRRSWWR